MNGAPYNSNSSKNRDRPWRKFFQTVTASVALGVVVGLARHPVELFGILSDEMSQVTVPPSLLANELVAVVNPRVAITSADKLLVDDNGRCAAPGQVKSLSALIANNYASVKPPYDPHGNAKAYFFDQIIQDAYGCSQPNDRGGLRKALVTAAEARYGGPNPISSDTLFGFFVFDPGTRDAERAAKLILRDADSQFSTGDRPDSGILYRRAQVISGPGSDARKQAEAGLEKWRRSLPAWSTDITEGYNDFSGSPMQVYRALVDAYPDPFARKSASIKSEISRSPHARRHPASATNSPT